eukprot:1707819-Prymnesium_polylepis.3
MPGPAPQPSPARSPYHDRLILVTYKGYPDALKSRRTSASCILVLCSFFFFSCTSRASFVVDPQQQVISIHSATGEHVPASTVL